MSSRLLQALKGRRSTAKPSATEPEVIVALRQNLRAILAMATEGRPDIATTVVFAVALQEAGHHTAAALLIIEHGLGKKFGISTKPGH